MAFASGEAALDSAAKGVSEFIGVRTALRELFSEDRGVILSVDSSACKGMLLRTVTGKVKHLSAKQLGGQGAVQSYGVEVPRASNASDRLTHAV